MSGLQYGRVFLICCVVAAATLLSCTESPTEPMEPPGADMRRAVLADVAQNVIVPLYLHFSQDADQLLSALETLKADPTVAHKEAAQQRWKAAMQTWQRAEMLQLGPAASMGEAIGGKDLRGAIYSWPLTSPCRIDQETVDQTYSNLDALAAEPLNVRGLDAIEYLLFVGTTDNACPDNSTLDQSGAWDALSADEVEARRLDYTIAAATLVQSAAVELRQAWESSGGAFADDMAKAGLEGSSFQTSQQALNALSDALFYLDTETKDMKLGEPAGITGCLSTDVCPEERESPFANVSKSHLVHNLRAFGVVMIGDSRTDARGFDVLMDAVGASDLADRFAARIEAAIAAMEAISGTLVEALTADLASVRAAYAALKQVTDLLKTEFMSVLDLELPQRAEGDND